jgi:hypothetical protein
LIRPVQDRINPKLSLAANHSFTPASYSCQPFDPLEAPVTWLDSRHIWRWLSRLLRLLSGALLDAAVNAVDPTVTAPFTGLLPAAVAKPDIS